MWGLVKWWWGGAAYDGREGKVPSEGDERERGREGLWLKKKKYYCDNEMINQ